MKLKVTLTSKSSITLPLHYNYILQSFIYRNMDESYSSFLHNSGFPYKKRLFKLFTFSQIYGKREILKRTKEIIFSPPIHFYMSCILKEIISSHAKTLLKSKKLKLGQNNVFLDSIEIIEEKVESSQALLKTLSPVTIHSTDKNRKTIYYNPDQEKFFRLLEDNLRKKCKAIGIDNNLENIEISPAKDGIFKKVVIFYKSNFIVEAWKGKFLIKANPKIIEIALKAGLGDRNSQGFGMVALC